MSQASPEPLLFVIAGPSGVGKGSIADGLRQRVPNLWLSRSWTTRPRRRSERADAYHFVDRPTFESAIEQERFLEWAEVFGQLYGTPEPEAPAGQDVLLEIDVQGATQVRHRHPEAIVIFIEAPSRQVQEERLRGRGESDAVIAQRMAAADAEEAAGRALADHRVVNDDLYRAIEEVAGIVEGHRGR